MNRLDTILYNKLISIIFILSLPLTVAFLINIVNINSPFSIILTVYHFLYFVVFTLWSLNNFRYLLPKRFRLKEGNEVEVAIIIPTLGESIEIIDRTVKSVLEQDYNIEKLHIIISDDSHRIVLKNYIATSMPTFNAKIYYTEPPEKDSEEREGEGKAGNLNHALRFINQNLSHIKYIETRDCDDLVGDRNFLRETLGQLIANQNLAFVQTIKDCKTSPNDPFGNTEKLFYRRLFLSKNSIESVFSCGSGVVWRRTAINSIGGFPTWNLVEDFQSGVNAIQKGWKTLFIPIVGAMGQTSPEDIPNQFKQRSIWAMDSIRFLLWGDKSKLTIQQRLSFTEPALFYFMSAFSFFISFIPVASVVFNQKILFFNNIFDVAYYVFLFTAMQVYAIYIGAGFNVKLKDHFRQIQIFFYLGPVYLMSFLKVLRYGKNRKPKYIVTRKYRATGVYIFSVIPQLVSIILNLSAIAYVVVTQSSQSINMIWSVFYILMYSRVIRNAFFGCRPDFRFFRRKQRLSQVNHNTYTSQV